jgi:hypothetical protein
VPERESCHEERDVTQTPAEQQEREQERVRIYHRPHEPRLEIIEEKQKRIEDEERRQQCRRNT